MFVVRNFLAGATQGIGKFLAIGLLVVLGIDAPAVMSASIGFAWEWLGNPYLWFIATCLFAYLFVIWRPDKYFVEAFRCLDKKKWWGISWSFERFLWISGNINDLKLISFDAEGVNRSSRTITGITGHLEDHKSGRSVPLYILRNGNPVKISEEISILPGEKFSIRAPFCGKFGNTFHEGPHMSFIEAHRKWRSFRFTFKYEKHRYVYYFSENAVLNELLKHLLRILKK